MSAKDAGPVANAGDPKKAHRNLATMNAGKSFVSCIGNLFHYPKKVIGLGEARAHVIEGHYVIIEQYRTSTIRPSCGPESWTSVP